MNPPGVTPAAAPLEALASARRVLAALREDVAVIEAAARRSNRSGDVLCAGAAAERARGAFASLLQAFNAIEEATR